MAQIPNLQSTNTLGVDDQAILRQGTIDKRIGLNLAGILSWAKRNGYTHLGEHTIGIQFPDTVSFTTFQGKTYFVNEEVTLPYSATSNDPSVDGNLYDNGEETFRKRDLQTYTDLVFDSVSAMVARGGYTITPPMYMKVQGENNQFVNYVTSAVGEIDLGGGVFANEVPQKFDNSTSVNEAVLKTRFSYNNHISNTLQVFAHRGFDYGSEPRKTPENTLLAISTALIQGITGIEVDVSVSADGVAYLFHDDTVDALTDGTGTFTQLQSSYIDTLKFNTVIGTIYENEPVARLEDALKLCRRWGANLIAEIKYYPSYSDVENILSLIENSSMRDITTVASGSLALVSQMRASDRLVNLAQVVSIPSEAEIDDIANIGNTSVMMNEAAVRVATGGNPSIVRYAKSKGVDVLCYTIEDSIVGDEVREAGVNKLIANRFINWEL